MSQRPNIPKLSVVASRIPGSSRIRWRVQMQDWNAQHNRVLGYQASGYINRDLTGFVFEHEPEVHDEHLPHWTHLHGADQPDLRTRLVQLATTAAAKLQDSGTDSFEQLIP